MKKFILSPEAAFLSALVEETPIEFSNRTQFHQRLYAVYCATTNGYADKTCLCPIDERFISSYDGGMITRKKVREVLRIAKALEGSVYTASNFYTSPFELSSAQIIEIKRQEDERRYELNERLAALSDEEWVDTYGFYIEDVEFVRDNCNLNLSREAFLGLKLSDNNSLGLTQRQRTAYMYILWQVHVGMQSVPEHLYSADEVFNAVVLMLLEGRTQRRHKWVTEIE